MDAPVAEGPDVPVEKKKGLRKYISRIKTVLKRNDGARRLSSIRDVPVVASSSKPVEPTPIVETNPEPVGETMASEGIQPVKIMRSQIAAERARKLGERFSVNIEPFFIEPDTEAIRVEKPIRVRIHRRCHVCDTVFGGNRVCTQCEHIKCIHCPRHPTKREEEDKGKAPESAIGRAGDFIEADTYYGPLHEQFILTKPSPRPGGQPLVRKKPKQRVRRTCHECATLFGPGVKICSNCQHVRCADCPRDPAKKHKYPDGYPGDAPSSNTSLPVKYSCHRCSKVFPPVPHPDSPEGIALKQSNIEPMECIRCHHPMCSDCPRAPPTRVDPAPDPDVLKSVQAKLESLNIANNMEAT